MNGAGGFFIPIFQKQGGETNAKSKESAHLVPVAQII
jgi:hypothetical protein